MSASPASGAANSAAGLTSKSCGTVILDEADKFRSKIKNEGDPIDLAKQRTNAFEGRRKFYGTSLTLVGESTVVPSMWCHFAVDALLDVCRH